MRKLLERWRDFMNESAMGVAEIPKDWGITIKDGTKKAIITLEDYREKKVMGKVVILNDDKVECIDALMVQSSEAPSGYGPMLYDVAMELAGEKGIYSDRTAVTAAAQNVWEFYEHSREDIESFHPAETVNEQGGECIETITQMFGEEWEDDPLNKIFRRKDGNMPTIDALKEADKLRFY
jgi:hypothetical protein